MKLTFNKKIFDNWTQKVLCLLLALIIYFFYQVTSLETKNVAVPLTVKNDGLVMPVSEIPSYVRVSFRGVPDDVAILTEHDIKIILDLSYFTENGEYEVLLQAILSQNASLLEPLEVTLHPDTIKVNLQKRIEAFIPLEPSIIGSLPDGYEVVKINYKPDFIYVTGPESIVKSLDYIKTEPVSLDGQCYDFSQIVNPLNNNSHILLNKNTIITVSVELQPIVSSKLYENVKIELYGLSEEFVGTPNIETVDILLRGNKPELDLYSINKVYVDCSSINNEGTYKLPILYHTIDNFILDSINPSAVTLDVIKKSENNTNEDVITEDSTIDGEE